jgi:hypothetical protein
MGFPTDRVRNFMVRVAKGIIRKFRTYVDYRNSEFFFFSLTANPRAKEVLEILLPGTKQFERGDVFLTCHGTADDNPNCGVIYLQFYGGSGFLVFFGPPGSIHELPT